MPELPEVETVRRGLDPGLTGRTIAEVQVRHARAVRRHLPGPEDFCAVLVGRTITGVRRRGKYLWFPLDGRDALVGHLGMSGQLLLRPADAPDETHLRVRVTFAGAGPQLRFVDQRTFGGLHYCADGADLPQELRHIARDPLDPLFDDESFVTQVRRLNKAVKRLLLDQTVISGIGNIYADEALWRASLHGARLTGELTRFEVLALLGVIREIFTAAISAGGTTFDGLYVNTNGESGRFSRSLRVYGCAGVPCARCGTPITREPFMNRSSYSCLQCQPVPQANHDPSCVDHAAFPDSS